MARHVKAPKGIARLGLASLLLCSFGTFAESAEPAGHGSGAVQIFGVYRDCALDLGVTDAITLRLQQMGERVRATASELLSAACAGSDCAQHLRAHDPSVQNGRLLGGRVRVQVTGEVSTRLWLSEIATGETVYSDDACVRCNVSELLARQAANLIEKSPATSVATKESMPPSGASAEGAAAAAQAGPKRIALSVKGAGVGSILTLSAAANKTLRQMGYDVSPASSLPAASGRAATETTAGSRLPTVAIELVKDKSTGSSSVILRHLTPSGGQTTLNIDCGGSTCRSSQLERIARMNIGILLDTAAPPATSTPSLASLVAKERAQAQFQDPTECQPAVATRQSLDEPSGFPGGAARPESNPAQTAQPVQQTGVAPSKYRPFSKPRRWVGVALVGAGVIGLGVSGWLLSQNDQIEKRSLGELPDQPFKKDTTAAFGTGFALSGAAIILGITLVAVPN